jgi:CBS domain-containing protein
VPVVNDTGGLIGVITTYELLHACLPDYILWTGDLTPIMDFEPFAEVLRTECLTCLAEIMNRQCATVQADAPAIEVAQEITRRRTSRAYIVEGQKLLGAASIETLLAKILRE